MDSVGMDSVGMDDVLGEAVLAVDVDVLDGVPLERLEQEITAFAGRLAAAQAKWLVWVGAYDRRDGWLGWEAKSCAHWLNWRCGVSMRTAREHVRVARRLEELPVLREQFLAGGISYSKVRAVSRVATEVNEVELVELALLSTASQVERVCGGLRRVQKLREEEGDAAAAVTGQSVGYTNNWDGTATITITAPVADAKKAHAAVLDAASACVDEARGEGQSNREVVEELGGLGRIQSETALGLLSGTVTAVDGPVEDVLVVVDHDSLTTSSDACGSGCEDGTCTYDGERISPLVARRLACDARLQVAVEDAVGDALGIGRSAKTVPRWLRRQLKRRDHGMCRFPGCCATRRLHAHHVVHWANGGPTELDNLILLCSRHHTSVHEGGWNVIAVGGRFGFADPAGNLSQIPVLTDPTPQLQLPVPESGSGENGSAEPLAASGERYDIDYAIDIIDTNTILRQQRTG